MTILSLLNLNSYLYFNHNHNLNLNPYQYQLGIKGKARQKRACRDSSVRKIQVFNIGGALVEGCQVIHSCFPTSTVPVWCGTLIPYHRDMGINGVLSLVPRGERAGGGITMSRVVN